MLKFFGKLSDLLSHSSLVNSTHIIQHKEHIMKIWFWHYSIFWKFSYYQVTETLPHDVKWSIWILLKIWHAYMNTNESTTPYKSSSNSSRMRNELNPQVIGMDDHQITLSYLLLPTTHECTTCATQVPHAYTYLTPSLTPITLSILHYCWPTLSLNSLVTQL